MIDLWVRSQDKTHLLKVENVFYHSYSTRGRNGKDRDGNEPIQEHYISVGNERVIGQYASEQRCLEILDEIQNIIAADPVPLLVFTNCDIVETEELYKGLNEMYKNGDLLALGTSSQENVKVFEKSTAVYQMPEK